MCVCDCDVFTMIAVSSEDVDKNLAIAESAHQLGYATLKELQVKAISSMLKVGKDFFALDTSVCLQIQGLLRSVFYPSP